MFYSLPRRPYFRFTWTSFNYWELCSYRTPLPLLVQKVLKRFTPVLVVSVRTSFEVKLIELEPQDTIDIGVFHINCLKVNHKITCYAYNVQVKRVGRFDVQKANALNIPKKLWSILQKQQSVEFEGKTYTSDMVLGSPRKGIKVSYCTDTRPTKELPALLKTLTFSFVKVCMAKRIKFKKLRNTSI